MAAFQRRDHNELTDETRIAVLSIPQILKMLDAGCRVGCGRVDARQPLQAKAFATNTQYRFALGRVLHGRQGTTGG